MFNDSEHLIILAVAIILVVEFFWNNRGVRKKFDALADAARQQPAPPAAEDIGSAVALKFADVLQPVFTLWKENSQEMRLTIENLRQQRTTQQSGFEAYKAETQAANLKLQDDLTALKSQYLEDKRVLEARIKELETQVAEVPVLKKQLSQFEAREQEMKKERDDAMIQLAKVEQKLEATKQELVIALSTIEQLRAQHEADLIKIGQLQAKIDAQPSPDPLAVTLPPLPSDPADPNDPRT